MELDIEIQECLEICEPYINKDYDGEPVMALGTAVGLSDKGVSGYVNIFPFTCLPGTFVASVAPEFRENHNGIPWVDVAYDGQEDTGLETRLQAFMHQAGEYADRMGYRRSNTVIGIS
jgi:predicted nucleotide-binding protein (sugar kinase/HSP70/actin superfamily)